MPNRFVVTGSLAYDHLMRFGRPFREILLPDQLHRLSVCFVVDAKERHFGGTAGNIGYNFSLLGELPLLVASVGRDFREYEERLSAQGFSLDGIQVEPEVDTASAIIMSDVEGNQIAQFHPGAMAMPFREEFSALQEAAEVLLIAPDDIQRNAYCIRFAQQNGRTYFWDPGQNLPYFSAADLIEFLKGATGLFLNDYELALFLDKTGFSFAELTQQLALLIVTHGERGSSIYENKEGEVTEIEIPIVPPQECHDPTGCGDAYRAGFLTGYAQGKSLLTCGQMGALLATYVVENPGTQNHRFTLGEFKTRYKEAFDADL